MKKTIDRLQLALGTVVLGLPTVAAAQPGGSPSGGISWMVFGGGFLLGLGAGLLWCWLWCKKKKDDRDERK